MSAYHTPVLLKEVLEGLGVKQRGKYIDATVGGGGHGGEIVKRGGRLLGIDADMEAVEYAMERVKKSQQESRVKGKKNWRIVQGNFRDIEQIAKKHGFDTVDGILFDLGVSSYQLDTARRGFSYRFTEAPLDMRLGDTAKITAANIVNTYSEEELYEVFARFGEEQLAGPIADTLVRARHMKPIIKTADLVDVISKVVRDKNDLYATLSRIFQALRITVNDEIGALREGLKGSEGLVKPGGRLAVISFHSLEDRLVKQTMQRAAWHVHTKHPITPTDREIAANPRSRSAKLRIAEKI